jgi:hypothetical protein
LDPVEGESLSTSEDLVVSGLGFELEVSVDIEVDGSHELVVSHEFEPESELGGSVPFNGGEVSSPVLLSVVSPPESPVGTLVGFPVPGGLVPVGSPVPGVVHFLSPPEEVSVVSGCRLVSSAGSELPDLSARSVVLLPEVGSPPGGSSRKHNSIAGSSSSNNKGEAISRLLNLPLLSSGVIISVPQVDVLLSAAGGDGKEVPRASISS